MVQNSAGPAEVRAATLPGHVPDYASFLRQKQSSEYAEQPTVIQFETSRGCWWGEKHHCPFCGIAAIGHGFQARHAEDAIALIDVLNNRYRPDVLYATDAILDAAYYRTVLPTLARRRRGGDSTAPLFYEVKSTVRRRHVALLAAAGVKFLQPGIETLSTRILGLMQKGARSLQQIECLKWAQAYGLVPIYGLIVGTPGECADDYDEMLVLVRRLAHLYPPTGVNKLSLFKFSPYAKEPERFGVTAVRPFAVQRLIYGVPDAELIPLCYELDYDLRDSPQPDLEAAHAALRREVEAWKVHYAGEERMLQSETAEVVSITRRALDGSVRVTCYEGEEAALLRVFQEARPIEASRLRLGLEPRVFASSLDHLVDEGLIVVSGTEALALPVPAAVNAYADAGLDDTGGMEAALKT